LKSFNKPLSRPTRKGGEVHINWTKEMIVLQKTMEVWGSITYVKKALPCVLNGALDL
jgi:hypothetical protein